MYIYVCAYIHIYTGPSLDLPSHLYGENEWIDDRLGEEAGGDLGPGVCDMR